MRSVLPRGSGGSLRRRRFR